MSNQVEDQIERGWQVEESPGLLKAWLYGYLLYGYLDWTKWTGDQVECQLKGWMVLLRDLRSNPDLAGHRSIATFLNF